MPINSLTGFGDNMGAQGMVVAKPAEDVSSRTYLGRILGIGMTPSGYPLVEYVLTGRSDASKARKLTFAPKGRRLIVKTEPTDLSVLQTATNPALLLYPVIMADTAQKIAISNGVQTPLALRSPLTAAFLKPHRVHDQEASSFEPDDPNFTPRISGELTNYKKHWLSTLFSVRRANGSGRPLLQVNQYELTPGVARAIPTYEGGNEKPLKPFAEDPLKLAVRDDDPRVVCYQLYSELRGAGPDDYRVSAAAVTFVPKRRGVTARVSIRNAIDGPDATASLHEFHLRRA